VAGTEVSFALGLASVWARAAPIGASDADAASSTGSIRRRMDGRVRDFIMEL
jgi:hypothetical protein